MNVLDIWCHHCGAVPGETCRRTSRRHTRPWHTIRGQHARGIASPGLTETRTLQQRIADFNAEMPAHFRAAS